MKRTTLFAILAALCVSAAHAAQVFTPGVLQLEFWQNKVKGDVEGGTAGGANYSQLLSIFQWPEDGSNEAGVNYTIRVTGFFIPPTTGKYVIFVNADDTADLWLSTDDTPANKRLIAQQPGWSNQLNWTTDNGGGSDLQQKHSDTFIPTGAATAPFKDGIPLVAGTKYYIEGVMNEFGGGDNFAATFKLVGEPDPVDGDFSKMTGNLIGANVQTDVSLIAQPQSRRVLVGDTPTLTVGTLTPDAQFQWFKGGTAIAGATTNSYQLPPVTAADNGATFYVIATNKVNSVQSSNAVITVGKLVLVPGAKDEVFDGATRDDVENGSLDGTTPFYLNAMPTFEAPSGQVKDGADFPFTQRLSAIFLPSLTGDYVFFIAADDDSDLFISTDATPAKKYQIAAEPGWSAVRNYFTVGGGAPVSQKRSDQWVPDPANPPATPPFATGIHLVAGNKYYLEGVNHEGGGGDNLAVTYKLVGEPDPSNGDASRLAGFVLDKYVNALDGGTITITNQPQNTTAVQSQRATLTIGATSGYIGDTSSASPGLSYQWQAAPAGSSTFTNIGGASGASFTTPVLKLSDTGTQFRVSLLAGDTNVTSSIGTLTVTPDTTAPLPVKVTSVNAAGKLINLNFNELLDKASAETGANYSFSPGNVAGASAVLDASGTNVTITTGTGLTPNTENTLTITGLKDLAGNPVAANTTIKFTFAPVTYEANIKFDGPLAYYRFEETGGSVATNSGSTGGNAVYTVGDETGPKEGGTPGAAKGDPGPRPGAFQGFEANNHAATFDGVGDWVDTRNQYLQNRAAFTLEYWVNPVRTNTVDGTVWPNRVGLVGQNDAIEYGFISPGTIQIWTPGGGSLDTAYPFPDGEWHHVATIADGTNLKNYFDGKLVGTGGSATANYGAADFNVHIGGGGVFDGSGNWFTGHIDEVAIFDKAIPADRVAAHYTAGKEGGVLTTSGAVTPGGGGGGGGATFTDIQIQGANVVIKWTPGTATLQSTSSLTAPTWSDVAGATGGSFTTPILSAPKYYRFKQP